ncbi:MAG: hypothetical protein U1F54_10210 [Burkholderiales bacterium]
MTEAFTVEEPTAAPADEAGDPPRLATVRQHESETPNERAMRASIAARKAVRAEPAHRTPRQQG